VAARGDEAGSGPMVAMVMVMVMVMVVCTSSYRRAG
jgi:hypothetical protein